MNEKNLTLYRSPEWALVLEIYIALHGVIMGMIGGLDNGPLALTLRGLGMHQGYSLWFCTLGTGLFVTALLEMRCRRIGRDCNCIKRFAVAREWFNLGLVVPWGFNFWLLFFSNYTLLLVPAISAQALIAVFIIQWENVSAQRLKAEERRGSMPDAVGHLDSLSG